MMIAPKTKSASSKFPHVMIRASAGTGKTFQLSNRFLALACAGERSDHILAATFARKAAGEITERVLLRLAEAALDPATLADLGVKIEQPQLSQTQCLAVLRALVGNLHRLRIGTLDRFFIQLAGAFSLELGLAPGWQIVDELDDQRLRSDAIRTLLGVSTGDARTLIHLLSKGEAVRSITQQVGDLVEELYEVYCETEPAAWRGLPRPALLSDDALLAATERLAGLNSWPDKRFASAHAGDLEQARAMNWEAFIGKGLAAKILADENYYNKPIAADVCEAYVPLLEHARADLLGQLANQTEATYTLLSRFDEIYQQLKIAHRALRFDDVTRSLARGLAAGQMVQIAHRLDAQIGHLLLDEFQDTSLGQWSVVGHFARLCARQGGDGSLFCVGDAKQAIYGWRGGISELFDAVGEQIDGLQEQSLNESYRSSPVVIDTVNRVFGTLADNAALDDMPAVREQWTARFSEHKTVKIELAGYTRLVTAPQGDDQEQATVEFAAAEIKRITGESPDRTIGVLVRRNVAVARMIYELRRHNVLASEEGGNPLTDSPAVQIILSLLTLADHPGDTVARFHVANSPLGPALKLTNYQDWAAANRLASQIRGQLLSDGYGRTVYSWVKHLVDWCDNRDLNRLLQLVELAYGYEDRATLRADDFVSLVMQRRVEDPNSANVRVMTIHQSKGLQFDIVVLPELDIALKGQPRRVVVGRRRPIDPIDRVCRYVNSQVQALLPDEFRRLFESWPNQVVGESLCLLYVAITRAVHAVHMIASPSKSNEKTWPKTFAGLLRSALADGRPAAPATVLHEHGDPNWHQKAISKAMSAEASTAPAKLIDEVPVSIRMRPEASPRRSLDRHSPTSLQGGAKVNLLLRLEGDSSAKTRGELVHAWLAEIKWLDDIKLLDAAEPKLERLREIAQQWAEGTLDIEAQIAQFLRQLRQKSIREILSQRGYGDFSGLHLPEKLRRQIAAAPPELNVFCERPFAIRDAGALVEGRIDRLVLISQGGRPIAADVIDFKTDRMADPRATDAKIDFYRPQVEAYRRAVAQFSGLDKKSIACRLVFLEADVACVVPARD